MKVCTQIVSALLLVTLLVVQASAASYDIQKELDKYGYLAQNDPSVLPPEIQNAACVPVATANSFVYLENKYPEIYGRLLVPDTNPNGIHDLCEIGAVASTLASANYMNTKVAIGGTWQDMGLYGKWRYMEDNAPGKTIYAAQMSGTWGFPLDRNPDEIPPIEKPDWVEDNTFPTWQFLYENLVACQDVEICINDGSWGHCLTLTSFHWQDQNEDGFIQQAEGATIDYIDPATGKWVAASPIWHADNHQFLLVSYGVHQSAVLELAVKESPIPEPSTLVLSVLAGLGLGWYARRRR